MSKKLTYAYVYDYFKQFGYILLSKVYESAHQLLEVMCPEGHIYNVQYANFYSGKRCPECEKQRARERYAHTYEYVYEYIKSYDYLLLSDTYINTKELLTIQCPEGHIFQMCFGNFTQGQRCPYCNGHMKLTYEFIKEYIKSFGYKLLTKIYENSTYQLLLVECPEGHQYEVTFGNFKAGHRCKICSYKTVSEKQRKDGKEVINCFERNNLRPLFNESDYINNSQKLPFICNLHKDEGVQYTTYISISRGSVVCKFCLSDKISEWYRLPFEFIENILKDKKLLFINWIDEYKNQKSRFMCKCENGHLFETCINNIKITKFSCRACFDEYQRGENSPSWKGGISSINRYLRYYLSDWYIQSMIFNKYKCIITGKPFDNIHHINSFNQIVKKTFNELNYQIEKDLTKYSQLELNNIVSKFLEIHNEYSLGLCLYKCIHQLFHKLYGIRYNTPEQFKEFVTRLRLGEFNDFLKENNLELNINYDILNQLLNQKGENDV